MPLEYNTGGRGVPGFTVSLVDQDGRTVKTVVPALALTDEAGRPAVTRENLPLITNSGTPVDQTAYGGDYYIRARATNWNGASVQLRYQDVDGATYVNLQNQDGSDVAAFTANRTQPVGLAGNSLIRAVVSGGPPTGLYVVAQRVPA